MTRKLDGDYYAARLRAEREAAATATCAEARASHQALADEYARLLADCGRGGSGGEHEQSVPTEAPPEIARRQAPA